MHLNAPFEWDGFRTDAFLLAVHRDNDGSVDRIALHNGSFVHDRDRTVYSALIKGDILWTPATLHAHLTAPARVDVTNAAGRLVRLALPEGPASTAVS